MTTRYSYEKEYPDDLKTVYTPLAEAVEIIQERRKDIHLLEKIENYLQGSIPNHFKEGPILYLSRHVASPNFETLRFIELCKQYPHLTAVIGQDLDDKFVSHNPLKRHLGKMPIQKGVARNSDDIIEFFTIIKFDESQGEKIRNVKTLTGVSLTEFHNNLLRQIYPTEVSIVDESDFVNNNYRGSLLEHYKRMLTLLIVHGIMFEHYLTKDALEAPFIDNILTPAFSFVEKEFGYKPLITRLIPDNLEEGKDWEAYPSVFYQSVKNSIAGKDVH